MHEYDKELDVRYKEPEICSWHNVAEAERPVVEGRLADCLNCDGKNVECGCYTVRGEKNNER